MTPARLLAEKALTFDAFSGGRLLINSVNGRENILTKEYVYIGIGAARTDKGEVYYTQVFGRAPRQ